jgi:beta-galactosidase
MKKRSFVRKLGLLPLLLFVACAVEEVPRRQAVNFNDDWRFARGEHSAAEAVDFDDSAWLSVRVPHDWAIAGPYQPQGDGHTGKLPWRGEGWYRKHFQLSAQDAGKRVYLDFDGVMAMPRVYVNGRLAGSWDYGYMSFRVDATDFVKTDAPNVVAVHVDTRPHSSRWYPGAGIYRKVQLVLKDPIHVGHWGISVSTPEITDASASVVVQTTVENHRPSDEAVSLETVLTDPAGREVAREVQAQGIPAGDRHTFSQRMEIRDPRRWDIDSPELYRAVTRVLVGGQATDVCETPFGVRTFLFTADDGFHLNGRRVQLQGVNLHHDHGPLGAAFYTRAMERQLEIMKEMGVNAVRTSHNVPAPELLELCDRMGLLVWNEVFDKWDGTSTRLPEVSILEHGRRQIDHFVRRDRNHPSVVVWSVGNEIWNLERLELPDSPGLLRAMVGFFKELDATRPVALAHAVPESARSPLADALDVAGWNYQRRYSISREVRPELPIVYAESASAYSTRGHYELPHPAKKDDYSTSLRISSYDHNSASWADLADTEFALMEQDRFVAGEFVWTGFDYLGEPVPFIAEGWGSFAKRKISKEEESRSSCFGIVDLVGLPKDRYFLYRSYWAPEATTIHLLPHWNWPGWEGKNVPVYVYTNGDSAELFINGVSQGKRSKHPGASSVLDRYRLRWEEAVYQPGEIRAVAYREGKELGETVVQTAGAPAQLRLTPDRLELRASGEDLCYLLIEALDERGNPCPLAMNPVHFRVTGPAVIAGVGNGDHHFPHEFVADHVPLFYGKAMLILRTTEGSGGAIEISAVSEGMKPGQATVRSGR